MKNESSPVPNDSFQKGLESSADKSPENLISQEEGERLLQKFFEDDFDFDQIAGVFSSYLNLSKTDILASLVKRDSVVYDATETHLGGAYYPSSHSIHFSYKVFNPSNFDKKFDVDQLKKRIEQVFDLPDTQGEARSIEIKRIIERMREIYNDVKLLNTYLHEQLHAVPGEKEMSQKVFHSSRVKFGFQTKTSYHLLPESRQEYHRLNEGFVDYITQDILVEYVRQRGGYRGISSSELTKFFEVIQQNKNDFSSRYGYEREISMVKKIIKIFALALDVQWGEIKKSFIDSYTTTGEIFSSDLEKMFAAVGLHDEYRQLLNEMSEPFWLKQPNTELGRAISELEWQTRYAKIIDILGSMKNKIKESH